MRNPTASVTTVSTVAASAQLMGIDPSGMAHILSILSNMYGDPSRAAVREYISNGLDSHVAAGNPGPVLVTSPSHLSPTFTVQDFGVGLSRDEVLNVYAKYGASTKRDSDTQIGAFGIGAKSAFAVGTQFVVTAVKDGELTVALFALDDNGAPTVNIVQHDVTDEPNGVKVEIGVRDVDGVQAALDKLCTTLPVGSILVDGVEPVSLWNSAKALADNIHLSTRVDRYDAHDPAWLVVMGGVAYALPTAVINSLDHRQRTIVHGVINTLTKVILTVPIGGVDITPSREDLKVTDKTTATLSNLVEKFNLLLPGWITEQIDEAKTLVGAMILRRQLQSSIGAFAREHLDVATWRGKRLGLAKVELGPQHEEIKLRGKRGSYYEKVARREKGLQLVPNSEIERMLFVVNVPERRVRSVQLAAKPYLQSGNTGTHPHTVVAITAPHFAEEWFDTRDKAVTTVEYDAFITEWKPATTSSRGPGGAVQYRIGAGGEWADTLTVDDLNDLDERILFLTKDQQDEINGSNPFLAQVVKDETVVFLKATQKAEVLVKKVPLAEDAWPHIVKAAKKTLKSLSQADVDTLATQQWNSGTDNSILSFLEEQRNGITNPVVLDVIDTHKKVRALRSANGGRVQLLREAAAFLNTTLDANTSKSTLTTANYHRMVNGMPLLKIYLARSWDRSNLATQHIVQYINSTAV